MPSTQQVPSKVALGAVFPPSSLALSPWERGPPGAGEALVALAYGPAPDPLPVQLRCRRHLGVYCGA